MPGWRSSRCSGLSTASPLRGRPRPRFGFVSGFFSGFGFRSGLSRASMAVESREMCSTTLSRIGDRIIASCTLAGNSLSANSANARENVASPG